jgi:hypothetical protein
MMICYEYNLVYHSMSHRNDSFFAGFREARRDALMRDLGQPPHVRKDGDMGASDEEGDPNPWYIQCITKYIYSYTYCI